MRFGLFVGFLYHKSFAGIWMDVVFESGKSTIASFVPIGNFYLSGLLYSSCNLNNFQARFIKRMEYAISPGILEYTTLNLFTSSRCYPAVSRNSSQTTVSDVSQNNVT